MTNSPAMDIRYLLEDDSSLALTYGTDLFIGNAPESPDAVVLLSDYGGSPTDPNNYYRPRVGCLVRGSAFGGYSTAYSVAQDIQQLLHEYSGSPHASSSYYYTGIWALGDPQYIGMDAMQRPIFTINFQIHRR